MSSRASQNIVCNIRGVEVVQAGSGHARIPINFLYQSQWGGISQAHKKYHTGDPKL